MNTRATSILALFAASALAVGLAACGASNALTTGTLMGGGDSAKGPKPITPSDRALYVGSTVARAQRCGFYFDPDQLRTNYIAAETQAGTPPDQVERATKEFDFTRQSVLTAAAKDDAYCTEGRTREVKTALGKQLAGDFNPPQKRPEIDVNFADHQRRERPFDGQKVFDASSKKQGPIGE